MRRSLWRFFPLAIVAGLGVVVGVNVVMVYAALHSFPGQAGNEGRDGAPLRGASVAASAERPLGAPETQSLVFHESDAGRYVADTALPVAGQWEMTLSASFGGHDIAATRRVVVH